MKDPAEYSDGTKTAITWLVLPPLALVFVAVGAGVGALAGDAAVGASVGGGAGFFFWLFVTLWIWFSDVLRE